MDALRLRERVGLRGGVRDTDAVVVPLALDTERDVNVVLREWVWL